MERIDSSRRSPLKRELKGSKGGGRSKAPAGVKGTGSHGAGNKIVPFEDLFPLGGGELSDGSLENLLDEIHESGEILKDKPTLANIRDYRQKVSKFMKYVVKNTLETDTAVSGGFNPLKKQKKYTIIRIINEDLDRLASGVMKNQVDQLVILEKIDEINGLIVNLLK